MNALVLEDGRELTDLPPRSLPAKLNPYMTYVRSRSKGSQPTVKGSLKLVARLFPDGTRKPRDPRRFPWAALRRPEMLAIRGWLINNRAPSTARKILSFVCGVLNEARRMGVMPQIAYMSAVDLDPVEGSPPEEGRRSLTEDELEALFKSCRAERLLGARDVAMLTLLYGAGLRRSEAAGVKLEHLDFVGRWLTVPMEIAKRRRGRAVPIGLPSIANLKCWLDRRGSTPGPILLSTHNYGRQLTDHGMSDGQIAKRVTVLRLRAGVDHFSCHDLRRACGSQYLLRGVELGTVRRILGHKSVTTTQLYDRRPDTILTDAAGKLPMLVVGDPIEA